jgi:Integrase core domain.
MKEKLTLEERYKFLRKIKKSYQKAGKKEKGRILNMVKKITGLHRKRLVFLLNKKTVSLKKIVRKGRSIFSPYKYDKKLLTYLVKLWKLSFFSCGKLLKPQIKILVDFYEKEYGEIDKETKLKLLTISSSTIDRLLKQEKKKQDLKNFKERTYFKNKDKFLENLIPIKTHIEWDFSSYASGHLQIDLVSHDGGISKGDFIQTLTIVDYKTGFIVLKACLNKAASNVFPKLKEGLSLFLFEIKSIHSDSGKEFINAHLFRYCRENNITFTRSRPYKKDDNFWVENRNDKMVRRNVGYKRYEGKTDLLILNLLYEKLYLYLNFFKPQRRCLKKIKIGAKNKKQYDKPKTAYERVLEEEKIPKENKQKLKTLYKTLNPIHLTKEIIKLQNLLLEDDRIKKEFIKKLKKNQKS